MGVRGAYQEDERDRGGGGGGEEVVYRDNTTGCRSVSVSPLGEIDHRT